MAKTELHAGHVVVCEGETYPVWEVGDPLLVRRGGLITIRAQNQVQQLTCVTCGEVLVPGEYVPPLVTREAYFDYPTLRRVVAPSEDEYYIAICSTCFRNKGLAFPEGRT